MNSFWEEVKQRRVVRTAIAYVVVAYAIVQGASTLFPALRMPDWTVTVVAVLAVAGLPIVVMLAWVIQLKRPVFTASIVVLAAVLAIGVTAGAFVLLRGDAQSESRSAEAAGLDRNRVLVAPFEDNTGDPALAAVGRMAADWLSQALIQTTSVEVVDRSVLEGEGTTGARTSLELARLAVERTLNLRRLV